MRVLVYPLCAIFSWNTDTCLAMRLCPGPLLLSKSHLSLSISLSLRPTLPSLLSLKSSWPKFTCGYQEELISARIAVHVLTTNFPSVFKSPIKYTSLPPEITPLLVYTHSTLLILTITSNCQPFTVTANHYICTAFYVVIYWTLRSTHFQTPICEGSGKN